MRKTGRVKIEEPSNQEESHQGRDVGSGLGWRDGG